QGEILRPVLLGYHHVAADLIWLRVVQMVGQLTNTAEEYEWLYHAMDVITTLDLQYVEPYQVGGIILSELGHRPDLSNKLLMKGLEANPAAWQIPFALGYNHFFFLQNYAVAADYMSRAAALPGRPPFVPLLAARLYAEAQNPETALSFLADRWRQTQDEHV